MATSRRLYRPGHETRVKNWRANRMAARARPDAYEPERPAAAAIEEVVFNLQMQLVIGDRPLWPGERVLPRGPGVLIEQIEFFEDEEYDDEEDEEVDIERYADDEEEDGEEEDVDVEGLNNGETPSDSEDKEQTENEDEEVDVINFSEDEDGEVAVETFSDHEDDEEEEQEENEDEEVNAVVGEREEEEDVEDEEVDVETIDEEMERMRAVTMNLPQGAYLQRFEQIIGYRPPPSMPWAKPSMTQMHGQYLLKFVGHHNYEYANAVDVLGWGKDGIEVYIRRLRAEGRL